VEDSARTVDTSSAPLRRVALEVSTMRGADRLAPGAQPSISGSHSAMSRRPGCTARRWPASSRVRRVAVIGDGAVGLCAVLTARAVLGAQRVILLLP